jgi:hypothetical protein
VVVNFANTVGVAETPAGGQLLRRIGLKSADGFNQQPPGAGICGGATNEEHVAIYVAV